MKKYLIFLLSTLFLVLITAFILWNVAATKVTLLQFMYDLKHQPQPVQSKKEINKVLKTLERLPYNKLSIKYLDKTKSSIPKYKKMLNRSNYYLVKQEDLFRPIVSNFRIRHFIPKDDNYKKYILNPDNSEAIVWLLNKKLLYKMLELQQILKEMNYDEQAFNIVSSHRHPALNEKVGGASRSRHIMGEAVDIRIGDIDKNGIADATDKAIVLDLLDKKIIKNEGGLGKYPGTKTVHFDVRGHRARWDKQ